MSGVIAFGEDGQIHTINDDGTNHQQLTSDVSRQYHWVSWSPDGQHLAAGDGISSTVFILDEAGTVLQNITNLATQSPAWGGGWSPDGTKLSLMGSNGTYFQSPNTYVRGAIQIVNVDNSGHVLIDDVSINNTNNYAIPWSPNGLRVAYAKQTSFGSAPPASSNGTTIIANPDGSSPVTIATASDADHDWFPWAWYPDNTNVLIQNAIEGAISEPAGLYKTDGVTRTAVYLDPTSSSLSASGSAVALSPDGTKVAWTTGGFATGLTVFDGATTHNIYTGSAPLETDGISWKAPPQPPLTPGKMSAGTPQQGIVRFDRYRIIGQ